jgi:cytochrome c5
MNRKTMITIVALVVFLSVMLSACGGTSEATNDVTTDATTDQTTDVMSEESTEGEADPIVPTEAMEEEAQSAPEQDGKALLEDRCVKCHTLDRVISKSKSAEAWGITVRQMVGKGAELTFDEQEVLIEYLSITYP